MSGPSERKGSCERQNKKGLRRRYDSNFKLMVSVQQRKQTIVLLQESSASLKISDTSDEVTDVEDIYEDLYN
jgi:hypothetical protein